MRARNLPRPLPLLRIEHRPRPLAVAARVPVLHPRDRVLPDKRHRLPAPVAAVVRRPEREVEMVEPHVPILTWSRDIADVLALRERIAPTQTRIDRDVEDRRRVPVPHVDGDPAGTPLR